MNEIVKMSWTAFGGELIFDFSIDRELQYGVGTVIDVYCRSNLADQRSLTIAELFSRKTLAFDFRSGLSIKGYLEQRAPVHINGTPNTVIFANIQCGLKFTSKTLHFEGVMVACPTDGTVPCPPPTPAPSTPEPDGPFDPADEPVEPLPVIHSRPEELFPYMYVRRWPRTTAKDRLWGFIPYTPPRSSPPSDHFFDDLVLARTQSRAAAQALVQRFLNGDAPYQNTLIACVEALPEPVGRFANMLDRLPRPEGTSQQDWLGKTRAQIGRVLEDHGLTWSYFESTAYTQTLDRVWQNYFALIVCLAHDTVLLEALTRTLRMAQLIAVILQDSAANSSPPRAPMPAPEFAPHTSLSLAQIAALLEATVVLPAQVFPLPPAQAMAQSPPQANLGWIEPYAIGDLQMVRQRLVRYQRGEIARIENVIRGERREVTHKRTHRQVDAQAHTSAETNDLQNDAADERSNLQEEARKTVAESTETNQYNKFTTSYGPPTQSTLDGSWSKATQAGAHPGLDDTTRFARDILNKTVKRISRSVSQTRSSSTMSQTEDSAVSLIDNTAGQHNMRAVFRWLNKVYEACVVTYGQRLMMEFMVSKPSARFIAQEQALEGQDFARPVPPAHIGVATFEDIQETGPLNYAQLGARYGVLDLEPPPLAERFASVSLRGGEEKQVAIPAGYSASHAYVNCISASSDGPTPVVLIGQQTVSSTAKSSVVPLNGEDDTVPVSVQDQPPRFSPPSVQQVQVNVEIRCVPTTRCMDQWRIGIYASIMRACKERLAAYQSRANDAVHGRSIPSAPQANRHIERREIKHACVRLLLDHLLTLTGTSQHNSFSSPPSEFVVNEPRYLQFFEEVLEWHEMTYSLHTSHGAVAGGSPERLNSWTYGDDALFASFLQADQARVLLPVQPAHVMAFLYFYSSGMLWNTADGLAPVNPADLALVNDLKHLENRHPNTPSVGPHWDVLVPTAMQVLDESGNVTHSGDLAMQGLTP